METRETSVKYQFDKEMVQFVKQLEIKTAMFGYDKTDVYKKFKDLLVRARTFCDNAVENERTIIAALEKELKELKDAMSLMEQEIARESSSKDGDAAKEGEADTVSASEDAEKFLSKAPQEKDEDLVSEADNKDWQTQERKIVDESSDTQPGGKEDAVCFKEHYAVIQEQIIALDEENSTLMDELVRKNITLEDVKKALSDAQEEQEALEKQLNAFVLEKEALVKKLEDYKDKEEALNHTEAILYEARLEGENIVREARVRAEQELFLFRARHRDEERAHEERVASLREEKKQLEQECLSYRTYINQGQTLMQEMKAYVEVFEIDDSERETRKDAPSEKDHVDVCDSSLGQYTNKADESDESAEAITDGER